MKIITNEKVYDLQESMIASGYAMMEKYDEKEVQSEYNKLLEDNFLNKDEENKHYKRIMKLTKSKLNSGHPNALSGVLVAMDVTFSNKVMVEWERYHFQQIVTSQSTMHRLSKMNLEECFVEQTDKVIIDRLKELQKNYNDNPTRENYLKLVYSCPSGLKLTMRVTTNYLQLMTMYNQRRNHRLPEWGEFCKELIEKLPYFYELLEVNGILDEKDKVEVIGIAQNNHNQSEKL